MGEDKIFQKSDEMQMNIYLQYAGKQVLISDLTNTVQKQCELLDGTTDKIKLLEVYLKPEDEKMYFVADHKYTGEHSLFNV